MASRLEQVHMSWISAPWLAVALLAFALMPVAAASAKPAVTVSVDSEIIADRVPPTLRYGGNIWNIPKFFPLVQDELESLPGGGTYRIGLAWEVLAASNDLDDLGRLLDNYPLNDFLVDAHRRGSAVVIALDAMPRWLAANKSQQRQHNAPAWARSKPSNLGQWAAVVEAVVRHFNGKLGLDAFFEVYNEPDNFLAGSEGDYYDLYKASVLGGRRADPKARFGGPSASVWSSHAERLRGPGGAAGAQPFFLQRFLAFAASTPLPELGLERLPVDFVSWHGYYRDPSRHYSLVLPVIRQWVGDAGYPRETPLIIGEWNIAADPPYPEGDLNGNYVGAAYAAATALAMTEAGVDRQVFQMVVDPAARGNTYGVFTAFGIPRPNYHAFRMLSQLDGVRLGATSGDPWIHAAAFRAEDKLYVMVAAFVPTPLMVIRAQAESLQLEDAAAAEALRTIDNRAAQAYVEGGAMPGGVSDAQRAVLEAMRNDYAAYQQKRSEWSEGAMLTIALDPDLHPGAEAHLYSLDESNAIDPATLERENESLLATAQQNLEDVRRLLSTDGVPAQLQRAFGQALRDGLLTARQRIAEAPAERTAPLQVAYDRFAAALQTAAHKIAAQEFARHDTATNVLVDDDGTLTLAVRPQSVHLLVFDSAGAP